MSTLEVCELSVRLPGRALVDRLSFAVEAGDRLCLLGASGSGKSVTARAIVGQSTPGARLTGRIRVDGCDVTGLPPAKRPSAARVAMVFQDSASALHPLIPIGSQIAATLRHRGAARGRTAKTEADQILESVGLSNTMDRVPSQLSGGQRQRACVVLALAAQAPVLIADEPTTALDVVAQAAVLDVLRDRVDAGTALIFITHDLAVATSLCNRVIVLAEGRAVEHGELPQLVWTGTHHYARELAAAAYAQQLPQP